MRFISIMILLAVAGCSNPWTEIPTGGYQYIKLEDGTRCVIWSGGSLRYQGGISCDWGCTP